MNAEVLRDCLSRSISVPQISPELLKANELRHRRSRTLFKLILLAVILAAVAFLWWRLPKNETSPEPPLPDFDMAMKNFRQVRWGMTFLDVQRLLGKPSKDPDDKILASLADAFWREANAEKYWKVWQPPDKGDRWIAIGFSDGTVYHMRKGGF